MTAAPPRPAPAPPGGRGAGPRPLPRVLLWAGGVGLAAVLVLALVVGGARPSSGLASAGPVVDWGRPLASLAGRVAALGTMGALLFAGALLPRPDAAPWPRAMRAASGWALAWAAATSVAAWLTLCELVGVGPLSLPASAAGTFVSDLPAGRAALTTLIAALSIALAAAFRPSVDAARFLLLVAGMGLVVPAVLTGHSADAANHMLAVNTLAIHVVSAAVWVGGLVALLAFASGTDVLAPAAARFSTVALWCFGLVGVSGVLAAWLALGEEGDSVLAVLGTGYGVLLFGKATGLIALGGFGWWHRRRTLPGLRDGSPGAFRRFAVVETGVVLATVAVAVALAASPPPATSAGERAAPGTAAAGPAAPEPAGPAADPMAGHDHGELSVAVLVDATRFHVAGPVDAGSRVTVHNSGGSDVTITAADGSFDVVVPAATLLTFAAPTEPGAYAFSSRHSDSFEDVLVVE